jgi:succinate dehydrogenase / fumarate reductase cytochrome b subunit
VAFLQSLPLLLLLEVVFIFVPILLHGILGVLYLWQAQYNVLQYGYLRNWLYTFQRYTGLIVFLFVLFHVGTMRFAAEEFKEDFFMLLAIMFENPLMVAVYMIGSLAAIYHFCNGLATFCIVWGITISDRSQKIVLIISCCMGIVLIAAVILSVVGFKA